MSETWIKKSRVMHAEFSDKWIKRHHFGGIVRRYLHRLLGGQNVEFVRIKDEAAVAAGIDWFPENANIIDRAALDIDQAPMMLCTKANKGSSACRTRPGENKGKRSPEIHPDGKAPAHSGTGAVAQG